jgi:hypothetical protein
MEEYYLIKKEMIDELEKGLINNNPMGVNTPSAKIIKSFKQSAKVVEETHCSIADAIFATDTHNKEGKMNEVFIWLKENNYKLIKEK